MDKQLKYQRKVHAIDTRIDVNSKKEAIDIICKCFDDVPEDYEFRISVWGFCKSPPYPVDDSENL